MKNFLEKLYVKTLDDEVLGRSAEIAFYFFFSLFPFLFFLVSLFGLVLRESNDLEARFFLYLKQIMPIEAYDLIEKTIREVAEKSSGSKITLGFLIAIWSASSGFDSFQTALNRIYNLQETRSILKLKLISLILTIVSVF
jgi:membrane protein